jgi:predicted CXXCH cytochrome family protein
MRVGQITAGVALAWVFFAGSAAAQESAPVQGFDHVLASKHNLLPAETTEIDNVCRICHIDGKETEGVAAWDPENTIRTFTYQHFIKPPLGGGAPENKPFGPSYDCLTCHDGVLGTNVHQLGFSGSGPTGKSGAVETLQTGIRTPDHPDSISYPRQPDGRLAADRSDPKLTRYWAIPDRDENGILLPTGPRSAALNLQNIDPNDPAAASALVRTFMGVIHCDTCHNPHNNEIRPFLRVPHKTLCLVCHDR